MIDVNIETEDGLKTYQFPESWEEITVGQFVKLYQTKNPQNNELMAAVNLISAISNIPEQLLLMMDIDDFKTLSKKATFVSQEIPKVDTDYIELEGEKYYLYSQFNKLTTGEVITIETIIESSQYDLYKVMGDLLCLFLRKKDNEDRYEKFTTDFFKRKEMFLQVPIAKIYHIFNFFLPGENSSKNNMKDYINNNDQLKTPQEDLQKS